MAISDPANCCYVSDATVWEAGIKCSLGKLKMPIPFGIMFPERLLELGFQSLPISHAHLHQVIKAPAAVTAVAVLSLSMRSLRRVIPAGMLRPS